MKKYGRRVNRHHTSYDPEEVVTIFSGEHRCITLMKQYSRKTVSKGFMRCIQLFIEEHKDRVVDLEGENFIA